jgi:CRISPR-associated protein Csd1
LRCVLIKSHEDVVEALKQHYQDFEIGLEYPLRIYDILRATFKVSDDKPAFGAAEEQLYMAAISGSMYPKNILSGLIERCSHLPQGHRDRPHLYRNFLRVAAAYGKAYINRAIRFGILNCKPLEETLDTSSTSTPYQLGRLLATLEALKKRAIGPSSPDLSESAMAMFLERPLLAFNIHQKNHHHHVRKLRNEGGYWFEKIIGGILANVGEVPERLTLEEKSMLMLGYVHQRNEFFKSKEEREKEAEEEVPTEQVAS